MAFYVFAQRSIDIGTQDPEPFRLPSEHHFR